MIENDTYKRGQRNGAMDMELSLICKQLELMNKRLADLPCKDHAKTITSNAVYTKILFTLTGILFTGLGGLALLIIAKLAG